MPEKMVQPSSGSSLAVLVVEDELLIAFDIQMMLEDNGHSVLGPAGSVEAALRLLENARPDVAMLDMNLRGELVIPVAVRLRSLGIPFVLSSAYRGLSFDGAEVLADAENIGKPISEQHVLKALGRAIASPF